MENPTICWNNSESDGTGNSDNLISGVNQQGRSLEQSKETLRDYMLESKSHWIRYSPISQATVRIQKSLNHKNICCNDLNLN